MILKIVTPQSAGQELEVTKVFFPGAAGRFEVLRNHAPMIAVLSGGVIKWVSEASDEGSMTIRSGYVEVRDNVVTVVARQ